MNTFIGGGGFETRPYDARPDQTRRYNVWIDRGGTFTDCIGHWPGASTLRVVKVLSSDRAPLLGIRQLLGLADDAAITPCDIRMGTTIATNALLERAGVRTALITTEGFGDLLRIGDQTRPGLFDLRIARPEVLYERVLELAARCDANGVVLLTPVEAETRAALNELRAEGIESVAIVFMHAYREPALERLVAAYARDAGFEDVICSHEVVAELGLLGRAQTTVVDAYLTPLIRRYMQTLLAELPGSRLSIMQSSGGLAAASAFRGRNAILSGPAGGAVACLRIARELDLHAAIGFDMGGTSTDVSRVTDELPRIYESSVAGVQLRAPMIDIHTVAAGGGSLCRFDGHRYFVGPESAGADPGPLCYGRSDARELALTDINVALGRVVPEHFPIALDRQRVMRALDAMAVQVSANGPAITALSVAAGFFEVAIAHMAEAIRKVSIARGHDVREHALIVFGGAGGQHGCAVARRLGIRRLVFHPLSGVLSAYGIGLADGRWHGECDAGRVLLADDITTSTDVDCFGLEQRGRRSLTDDGWDATTIRGVRRVDLRYRGTETAITMPIQGEASLRERFEALHHERFGYVREGYPIEVVTLRVELFAPTGSAPTITAPHFDHVPGSESMTTPLWIDGAQRDVPLLRRAAIEVGAVIDGPVVVLETTGTIVVEPGFALVMRNDGVIVLNATSDVASLLPSSTEIDPVRLEIFNHLYMSIAEQMGIVLQRTALSTNIRERMDFSCAVFDASGQLVANAPHIPVHLGAMGESVRAVIAAHPELSDGDVFATNDPAAGGSHLPDITVVTPVFHAGKLTFFTANRGHHSDVGGISPGSMPPFSTRLDQEGVVLRALPIVVGGVFQQSRVRELLTAGPYPARDPDQNIADLQAQVAANRAGVHMLRELVRRSGLEVVSAYMLHVQHNAETMVREAILALPDGEHGFSDTMDDGTRIAVRITVRHDTMHVDFTGSSPEVATNLNAPRAVTIAAVLYVLRCLVGRPIPLNEGCLAPVEIIVPTQSVLAPSAHAAVVAGNVETSQRIVDVLLGALGQLAACQGTMNNLTFGNERFGYYETICGGAGAGPTFDGAAGVHTHMTNTRITDPEVMEARFPVRVLRFGLRRGSGGAGRHRGGDGVVRELEALEPLNFSILSERRTTQPFGLAGGSPGASGHNYLNGIEQPGRCNFDAQPGDVIRIETPGGGGYGAD